jgi:hypothetical protein
MAQALRGRPFGCVIAALLAVAAVVLGWVACAAQVWRHFAFSRLRDVPPAKRAETAKELADSGERGLRVLEAVAFAPDLAVLDSETLAVRQVALDALWDHEPRAEPSHKGPGAPSDERLARYVAQARGLARGDALQKLKVRRPSSVLFEAALETVLTDTDSEGSASACFYLVRCLGAVDRAAAARRSLRAAARLSSHAWTRTCAIRGLGDVPDPEDAATLREALGDPVEEVRTAAALVLADPHRDPAGVPVLVAALRRNPSVPYWDDRSALAAKALGALRDRRAVAALVCALESGRRGTLDMSAAVALEGITGSLEQRRGGRTWSAWLSEHRGELPPQLAPSPDETEPESPPLRSWR